METPTHLNPLGAKGIGESGTIGSHAGRAVRRHRRGQPPRRAPHRHAVHRRASVDRDPSRRQLTVAGPPMGEIPADSGPISHPRNPDEVGGSAESLA